MAAESRQLKSWKVAVILSVMLMPFIVALANATMQGPGPSLLPGVMGSAMMKLHVLQEMPRAKAVQTLERVMEAFKKGTL